MQFKSVQQELDSYADLLKNRADNPELHRQKSKVIGALDKAISHLDFCKQFIRSYHPKLLTEQEKMGDLCQYREFVELIKNLSK